MDIQCEDSCFHLEFFIEPSKWNKESKVITEFCRTEEGLFHLEPALEVAELVPLSVLFKCDDPQAKLYIEGMDELLNSNLDGEERAFFFPSDELRSLFSYEDYPLIPGYYQIVVEVRAQFYYACVAIKPKHLSRPQWKTMRDELEKLLPGIATDLIYRNLGFGNMNGMNIPMPPYKLLSFLLIAQNFSKVMSALSDLTTKANFKLKKEYIEKPISSGSVIDEVTLKQRLRRPDKKETVMSPVISVDYDLQENRWIKKILFFLGRNLEGFIDVAEKYIEESEKEIYELLRYGDKSSKQRAIKGKRIKDISCFCKKAKKMQSAFKMLENTFWFQEVSQIQSNNVPQILFIDSRYKTLYKLYNQVRTKKINFSLDPTYNYQWKRTDKLYEIWCLLQVSNALKTIGYSVCGGWFNSINTSDENILIPAIPAGSYSEYKNANESIMIRMFYDAKIPYEMNETDHDNSPLYMCGANNQPDIRLDVYIKDTYSGSLLMDVKYRRPSSFWDASKLKMHLRSREMIQLVCYSTQCMSAYLYGDNILDIRPVPEVWVIYPEGRAGDNNKFFKDHRIRFICLSPTDSDCFVERLRVCLAEFEMRAERKNSVYI